MKPLSIPNGSAVLLGRSSKPMPKALSDAIGEMVRGNPGIREAYLPQCYLESVVEPPAQVLVLVLDKTADCQNVMDTVEQGFAHVLPEGIHLDVWPMSENNNLLSTVRGTRTHLHCAPPPEKKPWWKVALPRFRGHR